PARRRLSYTPGMTTTHVTYIGGPTALIEYGELRILLDPTFDDPRGYANNLRKTAPPGLSASAVEPVDLVLLSPHAHADNLDHAGRELALRSPLVLSGPDAAAAVGEPVTGLTPWPSPVVGDVTIP